MRRRIFELVEITESRNGAERIAEGEPCEEVSEGDGDIPYFRSK